MQGMTRPLAFVIGSVSLVIIFGVQAQPAGDGSKHLPSQTVPAQATIVVAASNSAESSKVKADFVCDGTDDQVEIQSAIDGLPPVGGVVLLMEGLFNTSAPVKIEKSRVVVTGLGGYAWYGNTVTQINHSSDDATFILSSTDTTTRLVGIEIRKLKISGNPVMPNNHGIWIRRNINGSIIDEVTVLSVGGDGFRAYADIPGSGWTNLFVLRFYRCWAEYCQGAGYRIDPTGSPGEGVQEEPTFIDCYAAGSGPGFLLVSTSRAQIVNCRVNDNDQGIGGGIRLIDSDEALIMGNEIRNWKGGVDGVYLSGSSNVIIMGNKFSTSVGKNPRYGLNIVSGDYIGIIGNSFVPGSTWKSPINFAPGVNPHGQILGNLGIPEYKKEESEQQVTQAEEVISFPDFSRSTGFEPTDSDWFYFLQISDTHITTDLYPQDCENFRRFITEVENLEPKPAFVVLTGDLVDSGAEEYWHKFHELVREFEQRLPDIPLHITLGNHDDHADIYLKLFPERKHYYSFDRGGIRFICIYPYPDEMGPTVEDDSASFGNEQIKWMQSLVNSFQGKTLVFFLHQPPISGDYMTNDLILDLRDVLSRVSSGVKVWVVSGHWHGNTLFRVSDIVKDRDVYATITASLHSDRDENHVYYRLFFVRNREIVKVATKSPEGPFQFDPPETSWQRHYPFYHPNQPVLLFVNIPDDSPYLVREKGCRLKRAYRDLRGDEAELVYRIPVPTGTSQLGAYVVWQYIVEVSPDGRVWTEIANSEKEEKRYQVTTYVPAEGYYKLAIPLPKELLDHESVYIRFRDPVHNSEHPMSVESAIEWFCLIGSE